MTAAETVTTYEGTFDFPAEPARVFAAWTEPSRAAAWLGDFADILPHVGGTYRFWGKSVPFVPTESAADGRIVAIEPPSRLEIDFTLRRCATNLRVQILTEKTGSRVLIAHVARGEIWPRVNEAKWVLHDFWRLAMGNLQSYLLDGTRVLRTDFTDASREVELSIVVDAPPEKVFAALTVPELMNKWLAKAAVVEPRVGGAYSYGWTESCGGNNTPAGPSKLVEIIPNRLLVHDWQFGNEPITRVRWELAPLASKTRVTLRHARFGDKDTHDGYRQGWAAFLVELWTLLTNRVMSDG